jgi:choline kinase
VVTNRKVSKAVILAAGDGDRLGSLTATCPKVLLPIADETPLISYPIKALTAAGINEIAIVVGYLGDQVIDSLGEGNQYGAKLEYIINPDYLGGNAISVSKVENWTQGEPIILCMGDHLIEDKLVKRLIDKKTLNETLCVDYTPTQRIQLDEATKVTTNDGHISNIGKDLVSWDAVDTGVFLLTENFFHALEELIHYFGNRVEISDVIRFLISKGHRFDSCNVSGCFWLDIDTEEDLNKAKI